MIVYSVIESEKMAVSLIFSGNNIKMKMKEYLEDLLNNQLKEIKYRYRVQIVDDIKNRMCSLLS